MHGCTAADLPLTFGADPSEWTVLRGVVTCGNDQVSGAFVRLLDAGGDFVAEVVTPATGDFRFFVAPGGWTLSVMHRDGAARESVQIDRPGAFDASVVLT